MTKTVAQQDLDGLRQALEIEQNARAEAQGRLRRLRADFQEFTARVSHDLREPLRAIAVYSQLISAKDAGEEDAKLYLDYIQDAVERTQILLTSMIEYAAVQAEPIRLVRVDMNAVYAEALRRMAPAPHAVITSDPLPEVAGDFDLLSKTLRHLLDNAIKFAGRPDPQVRVSARRDGDGWIISVRDNGPGIEPAHHEKIFGLFRRLHGREFPGTGLGLAFARGVVDALGGRIWVESAPGQGSVFLFTLPAAD